MYLYIYIYIYIYIDRVNPLKYVQRNHARLTAMRVSNIATPSVYAQCVDNRDRVNPRFTPNHARSLPLKVLCSY